MTSSGLKILNLSNNNNIINNKIPSYETIFNYMKDLIKKNLDLNLYKNALFYAEKTLNFSINHDINSYSESIYMFSKCLYLNKEYSRCVNFIQKFNMIYYNLNFLILLGQALYACEDYESLINYLEKENISFETEKNFSFENNNNNNFLLSVKYLLIGKAYEMQENKQPAIKNYLLSLEYDADNIEAFEILISNQLLTIEKKNELLNNLKLNSNNNWLSDYYKSKIDDNIFMTVNSECNLTENDRINIIDILYKNNDMDLMKMESEKFFITRDYINTFNKLKKINEDDFYNLEIIPMLCSSMIELNKIGDLYSLSYKLANNCGEKYISWYAVGCYYYSIKKYEMSRKYFLKCNQLNKNFPEGWIALGNSYAGLDESDQALNAYRTCLRLFPGCHFSNLYIGMEFIRTNNFKTAFNIFQNALMLNKNDPLVFNEIGVVNFKQKKYEDAENNFINGLKLCNFNDRSVTMMTILINYGHCLRKMRKFKEAIDVYMKVYLIDSRNVDVLNAIGSVLSFVGKFNEALDFLHRANFIKSNDGFSTDMINKCINDISD
jgi:anaphase-promoting complex subunit 6